MQRLNIPLSRHKRTTRRSRWVVWVLILVLVGGLFLVWNTGRWWFSGAGILEHAPVDTVAAVHLRVNPGTSGDIEQILAKTPLISDRSLTFSDLKPYIHGDLAWFFTSDGRRTVSIRGDYFEISEAFANLSLSIEEVDQGIVMLSKTLPAISVEDYGVRAPLLPTVFRQYLGQIVLPLDDLRSRIYLKNNKLSLNLGDSDNDHVGEIRLPQGTIMALSTLSWTNKLASEDSALLNRSFIPEIDTFSALFEDFQFVLAKAENGNSYLAEGQLAQNIDIGTFLQTLVSAQSPEISERALEDGTTQHELRISPELVSIEEVTSSGMTYLRAKIEEGDYLYALENIGSAIISNSESLLSFWVQTDETDVLEETACPSSELYVDLAALREEMKFSDIRPLFAFIQSLTMPFSHVSLETKGGSRILNLCFN